MKKLIMISSQGEVVEMEVRSYNEFVCEASSILVEDDHIDYIKIMFYSESGIQEYSNDEVTDEYIEYIGYEVD